MGKRNPKYVRNYEDTMRTAHVALDVQRERVRQDAKHGGPEHDDEHTPNEWAGFIKQRLDWVTCLEDNNSDEPIHDELAEERKIWIEVAALAYARIEAIDRHHAKPRR